MTPEHERKPEPKPARRGRPFRGQAEDIDRRVLKAAGECFIENGYAGTTLQMIAARAGVTKPTLYQRHADKEALLRAVVHARVEAWSAISRNRKVDRGETLSARLRYYGRAMLYWSQDPDIRAFADLIRECHGSAPSVAREIDAIRTSRMIDQIASDTIEYGFRERLIARDPRQFAAIFFGMMTAPSATADAASDDDHEFGKRFVDHVVDLLMAASSVWALPTGPTDTDHDY